MLSRKCVKLLSDFNAAELTSLSEGVRKYIVYEELNSEDKGFTTDEFECSEAMVRHTHHLPLVDKNSFPENKSNWRLPDEDKTIICDAIAKLNNYAEAAIRACSGKCMNKYRGVAFELLPPWVVFPLYDSYNMGWRMGLGQEYLQVFMKWKSQLTPGKRDIYEKAHPMPSYMDDVPFCFNEFLTCQSVAET